MDQIDPLEQDALNALDLNLDQQAAKGLEAALQHYQSLDDLAGQWRIHLIRTKLAKAKGDLPGADREVERLREFARQIGSSEVLFETYILLAQIKGDERYYSSALAISPTPLKRAVVLTYLDRVEEAIKLVDPVGKAYPDDRAFVLFRYALRSGREEDMQRALEAYRIAEDSRGVADSLVHLSRLAAKGNQAEQARVYGNRAVTVLTSIGEIERAYAIQDWLNQL